MRRTESRRGSGEQLQAAYLFGLTHDNEGILGFDDGIGHGVEEHPARRAPTFKAAKALKNAAS